MRARERRQPRSGHRGPRHAWFPVGLLFAILLLAPALAHAQADTVTVRWTAPGDDGTSGTAASYDLRYSEQPIDAANFDQAIRVDGTPAPLPAGTRQGVVVRGLVRGTAYFFAVRTTDDAGNVSPISNVAYWNWILDTAPPAAPSGLAAAREGAAVRLQWGPNSESDLLGYTVYRSASAGGPYTAISGTVTGSDYLDSNVPSGVEALYYQVTALDRTGNESGRSAAVAVTFSVAAPTAAAITMEEGYPNPSGLSSSVRIPITTQGATAPAVLDVLESGGRRVRRIELGSLAPGTQEVVWDGKNDAGMTCAPGVYRGWLIAGSHKQSIRLVRVP